MWINTVLFAAGILLCQQLQSLPHFYWSLAVLLLMLFAMPSALRDANRAILAFLLFGLGFSWAVVYGHWKVSDRLEPELIKQPIVLTGSIVELPRHDQNQQQRNWRFVFEPGRALLEGKPVKVPSRIRLGWYKTNQQLRSGQRWQLLVKLKPPTGLLNPGLFDFESWLFQKGMGARGYIVESPANRLLEASSKLPGFDQLREHIRLKLTTYSEFPSASALVTALTVGDKSRLSQQSWDSFRALGINHLVAISGLHVGMVVMVIYWLSGRLWRLSVSACEWIPAPRVQAVAGLIAAFFYAGMAGFSLPTQRALIMIAVVLLARLFLVNMQPFRQLSIAVFVVLLWDPPAIIAPGFWLSFMAVTAIFLSIGSKQVSADNFSEKVPIHGLFSKVRKLVVMQWSITLLLLPFSLLFFKQVSVVSPIANLLLIPLFSFFVVPVALLMTFLNQMELALIESLFLLFLALIEWLLGYLEKLSRYDWLVFQTIEISVYRFTLLLLPVFVWYLGRFRFQKPIAVLILVTALFFPSPQKSQDQLLLSVLDIGQGTSILLETAGKVLLYDLGPRYGNGNSATMSVVVPFLKNRGIDKLDKLVISHSDSDHVGDLQGFLQAINVEKIVTGEVINTSRQYALCQAGQRWRWQQTMFEFLSPDRHPVKDNNASCVLRVDHGENSLLLTGDIERAVERRLLKSDRQKLAVEVVLVPHHGSKSSSTTEFVNAVDARFVINTSAYLNRYGFPKEEIRKRWLKNGATFLNTGDSGALELVFGKDADDISVDTFSDKNGKYWHWPR
ncbi:MAG: DNA internalization-related competence protein ComEC/Rec2 [Gammaproteobacteria bacterium]|nr:DNA internalization-related competence protein ComEC/Rec2 [Gammaproteobacteria bacterium]